METIHDVHDDLLIKLLPKEEIQKCSDIISQLRLVMFKDKLHYVMKHFNNIDKPTK